MLGLIWGFFFENDAKVTVKLWIYDVVLMKIRPNTRHTIHLKNWKILMCWEDLNKHLTCVFIVQWKVKKAFCAFVHIQPFTEPYKYGLLLFLFAHLIDHWLWQTSQKTFLNMNVGGLNLSSWWDDYVSHWQFLFHLVPIELLFFLFYLYWYFFYALKCIIKCALAQIAIWITAKSCFSHFWYLIQPFIHQVNNNCDILFQLLLMVIAYRFARSSSTDDSENHRLVQLNLTINI